MLRLCVACAGLLTAEQGSWRADWLISISNGNVTAVSYTADGTAYISNPDSVYKQDPKTFALERIDGRVGLPHNATVCSAGGGSPAEPAVWLGSAKGLVLFQPKLWKPYQRSTTTTRPAFLYFSGPRWLVGKDPQTSVLALSSTSDGGVWVLSQSGLALVSQRMMTLYDKSQVYQAIVLPRSVA